MYWSFKWDFTLFYCIVKVKSLSNFTISYAARHSKEWALFFVWVQLVKHLLCLMYCSCHASCGIQISPQHLILVDVITTNILKKQNSQMSGGKYSQTQLKWHWLIPCLIYSIGCSVVPINLSLLAITQIFSPLHHIIAVLNYV
jgi:hypothetical protein